MEPTDDDTDHNAPTRIAHATDNADDAVDVSAVAGPLPGVANRHPVLACVDAVAGALKDTAGVDPVFMTTPEKAEALLALSRLADQVTALGLQVAAVADDVAEANGARDVAAWLAHHTNADPAPTRADLRLAHALYGPDPTWPQVGTALAEGRVTLAQARVITHALDRLPTDLDHAASHAASDTGDAGASADGRDRPVRARAEAHLVGQAADFAPRDLRILGRRVLDVIAPEVAEAEEARQLAAEEAHARAHTSLRLRPLGDGTTHLAGRIPDATAGRLATYLHAYTSPRQANGRDDPAATTANADGTEPRLGAVVGERIPYDRQLGEAFCSLLEHLDPDRLPIHGGDATTVMVTMTLDQLVTRLTDDLFGASASSPRPDAGSGSGSGSGRRPGTRARARAHDDPQDGVHDAAHDGAHGGVAQMFDGTRITAAEARRLACNARLIPAVLGGESQPLDLGRSRRLFNAPQRKALRLRDRECRAEGCTVPGSWCEAHHATAWADGGKTDLADGILLCSHHHHRAHDPTYTMQRLPNGDLRYHRRT